MNIILLGLASALSVVNTLGARLNKNTKIDTNLLFVCVISLTIGTVCVVIGTLIGDKYTAGMIMYAAFFAICYIFCLLGGYKAYKIGPYGATVLFLNCSMALNVVISTLMFGEFMAAVKWPGLFLMLASMSLIIMDGKKRGGVDKITPAWLALMFLLLIGNSAVALSVRSRQIFTGGDSPFAFISLCYLMAFVLSGALYLIIKLKNGGFKNDLFILRNNSVSAALLAAGNGGANALITYLATSFAAYILYPVTVGASLALSAVLAVTVFKETAGIKKLMGIAGTVAAIVFLAYK